MSLFTDEKERTWTVRITVADLKTLRELKAHPDHLLDKELKGLAEFLSDPERLVQGLYALCHEQAKAANVTPEEFATGFGGDGLAAGADAFVNALADFSHGARRTALREIAVKMVEVQTRMGELATEKIRALNVETLTTRAMNLTSTNSATDSAESLDSIPAG